MPNPLDKEWLAGYKAKHREQYPQTIAEATASTRVKSGPKKRNQPESDMQIALFDMIYLHEPRYPLLARVFHVPNEGYSGPKGKAKGQKRHREGVRAGIFDIFVDVAKRGDVVVANPGHSTPNTIFERFKCPGLRIELKAKGGTTTDAQQDWLNYYRKAGYRAEVCFSWETAWNIICDYLGYEEIKV